MQFALLHKSVVSPHTDAKKFRHLPGAVELLYRAKLSSGVGQFVKLCFISHSHDACFCELFRSNALPDNLGVETLHVITFHATSYAPAPHRHVTNTVQKYNKRT